MSRGQKNRNLSDKDSADLDKKWWFDYPCINNLGLLFNWFEYFSGFRKYGVCFGVYPDCFYFYHMFSSSAYHWESQKNWQHINSASKQHLLPTTGTGMLSSKLLAWIQQEFCVYGMDFRPCMFALKNFMNVSFGETTIFPSIILPVFLVLCLIIQRNNDHSTISQARF